jgi:uncharacterized membrane protein YdjX (TVP38/TMEM64 family)
MRMGQRSRFVGKLLIWDLAMALLLAIVGMALEHLTSGEAVTHNDNLQRIFGQHGLLFAFVFPLLIYLAIGGAIIFGITLWRDQIEAASDRDK